MSNVEKLIARVRELDAAASEVDWQGASGAVIAEYRTLAPRMADMLECAIRALDKAVNGTPFTSRGYVLSAYAALDEIKAMAEGGES